MTRLLQRSLPLLAALALSGVACVQPGARQGMPALPEGFGALLPDAPLAGYVYLSQLNGEPLVLDTDLPTLDGSPLPLQGRLEAISLWLSPIDERGYPTLAARLVFVDEDSAAAAQETLAGAAEDETDLWVQRADDTLDVVVGNGLYTQAFQRALEARSFTTLPATRMNIWNTTLSLPRTARHDPIAAGYLEFPPEFLTTALDFLASRSGIDLGAMGGILTQVGVGHLAFVVYGESPPLLRFSATPEELAAKEISALVTADTSIPAPLLSWSFNLGAQRAGLLPIAFQGGRAYLYRDRGMVTLSRTVDRNIFAALAFSESEARDLLGRIGQ